MKRGQASLEYVILVGLILLISISFFYYASLKTSETINYSQAEDTINTLAKAADEVYAIGPGTKKFVWVNIPGGTVSSSIANSEISLVISLYGNTSDYVAITRAPIVGSISIDKGTHYIPIEHLESGIVQIGEGNDSQPPEITWLSPEGLACNPIVLRANTNEPANCKFDTSDQDYDSMSNSMVGSSLGHSSSLGVQAENDYKYYVRCKDAFGNTMNTSNVLNYSIDLDLCTGGSQGINDTTPPIISLINPEDNYFSQSSQLSFYYNVTDNSSILLCNLIADDTIITSTVGPERNITNNITGNLDLGNYSWSVNCTDSAGNQGNSSSRAIEINATLFL